MWSPIRAEQVDGPARQRNEALPTEERSCRGLLPQASRRLAEQLTTLEYAASPVGDPNTNLGAGSFIYMVERQARHIRQAVEHLNRPGVSYMDIAPEVEDGYDEEIQRRLGRSVRTTCASWYRQENGRVSTNWPGLVTEYDRRTKAIDLGDHRAAGPR